MIRLKIVTYTQDLINKSTIDSIVLLTKDGKQMSILTGMEYGNVREHVASFDVSLKTIVVENPVICGTTDYDETEMLDMFEDSVVLYGDVSFNGDSLFADEVWIKELTLQNEERCVSIDRAVPRNFYNHAFAPFKSQQRYVRRDFEGCLRKAIDTFMWHDLEADPTEFDSTDYRKIARAIADDVWEGYDRWKMDEKRGEAHV